jgi:hypothetical protein
MKGRPWVTGNDRAVGIRVPKVHPITELSRIREVNLVSSARIGLKARTKAVIN